MASVSNLLFVTCLILVSAWPNEVEGQRSLLHWKLDLEYRINLYLNQRKIINDIVASSIYSPPQETLQAPANVVLRGNVRFTDLIIPQGSLLLQRHVAEPTVRILYNKTRSYVSSKMIELDQIRNQLSTIKRQIDSPDRQFIDKGAPNMPKNNFSLVQGNRVFRQFLHGHIIESDQVDVRQINFTLVDKVINDTYMDNLQYGLRDSKSRLFFEGRKTLWRTVFQKPLRSGCCDRLRPLHTDHMMFRSKQQEILAPVMFQTNDMIMREPVVIRRLSTSLIYNSKLVVGLTNQPHHNGLLLSPPENPIQLGNLIHIGEPTPREIYKTIIFRDAFMADEVQLSYTSPNNRLSIGIASNPRVRLDLAHENYLLKYAASRNNSPIQHVAGRFIINSETQFLSNLESQEVNRVANFYQFVLGNVVRIDRPANISGSVHFNALSSMFVPYGLSRPLQNIPIMRTSQNLNVGLINGMRIPSDIFIIPPPLSPQAYEPIRIRGPRHFIGPVHIKDHLLVRQLVNGMQMPEGVIPLHLNDFMGSVWPSNLWFLNGIDAQQITIESGQFDEIILRDVHGDAQSLIMRSMMIEQPDGSRLIRAPMRIKNLIIKGNTAHRGLLNGFKPESIMGVGIQKHFDTLYGKKTFLAPVEATDCVFNDINHLANWTSHLIRIDRPNTIQTVQTKLAFVPTATMINQQPSPSSVHVDNFGVEFYPHSNPSHYLRNLNFSPELFILQQALLRGIDNQTGGRYRVLDQVRLMNPARTRVNGVTLSDIVTLDQPFKFSDRFVMVGKVDVAGNLKANRITSNYPIDAMDLVQFDKYRIPIAGSRAPIHLNNLVLSGTNQASFVQCHLLNGISFNEFVNSIMSLTRPQIVDSTLVFRAPINFEGLVRTESSLNGLNQFKQFTRNLRSASYSFEDGLQCNSVMIRT